MLLWEKVVISDVNFSVEEDGSHSGISSVTLDFSGNRVKVDELSYSMDYMNDLTSLKFEIISMFLDSGVDVVDNKPNTGRIDRENYRLLEGLIGDKSLVELALNQRREIMASIGRDDNFEEYSKVYDATATW